MSFNLTFNSEECKGCEICMEWCAKKLLVTDGSYLNKKGVHPVLITDMSKCVGCLNCALMCPDCIITVEKLEDEKGNC